MSGPILNTVSFSLTEISHHILRWYCRCFAEPFWLYLGVRRKRVCWEMERERGISHLFWEKIVKEEGEKNAYD
jgi:hypothetical protein